MPAVQPLHPADEPSAPPGFPARAANWRRWTAAWPLLTAGGLTLAATGFFVRLVFARNAGHWEYPIDDAYGHLAVAKNLVRHGVWTYSAPNGFDSGISSLAWPLLLAASFLVTGVNAYATLALNGLSALGLLWYAARMLRRAGAPPALTAAGLLAVAVFTPLPLLIIVGMEHCFHALVSLVFLDLACRTLARGDTRWPVPAPWALPVAAGVLTLTRYEGMFLAGATVLLLLCQRDWKKALTVSLAAAAPITAFGVFSLAQGWPFLPCSVLLKGTRPASLSLPELWIYAQRGYVQMTDNPHMLFLVLALALLLVVRCARGASGWSYLTLLPGLALMGTLAHLQFAALGWFYRYEAYLVAVGCVAATAALADVLQRGADRGWRQPAAWPRLAAWALVLALFGLPFWQRTAESCATLVDGCRNVDEQQYQMARFLHRYYEGEGVAANDIGNIAFYTDTRLLDTAGLVNQEVMRRLRAHTYDQAAMRRLLARYDVQVIVVYDTWAGIYGGQLPEWGVPVGRWTIPDNRVCASETVSFYAPRPELAPRLTEALREFAPSLPADVVQEGIYRGTPPPHALGVYFPDFDSEGTYYQTSHYADFYLPPDNGWPAPPPDSALAVSVRPRTAGQTLEISVNGQAVQRKTFSASDVGRWTPLLVRGPWRPGTNVLSCVGQGQTVTPPGDNRPMLFAVREPRWTTAPAGAASP